MSCDNTCSRPGCDKPRRPTKPRGRPTKYCSKQCLERVRSRKRRERLKVKPARKRYSDLGPAIPLNGWTEEDERKRRVAKCIELIREGVPYAAIKERLGVDAADIAETHKLHVPPYSTLLPFGPPL